MIDKIFKSTGGADQITEMGVQYFDCTLKMPVGPHNTGEVFDAIYVELDEGVIALYRDDVEVYQGKLELKVL